MDRLLDDRAAVVTGGASGIGRAIAHSFAAAGADVVVADRRPDPREGGVPTHEHIISETDRDARFVECDVRDPAALDRAVATAEDFGGIDVMVNNVGVFHAESFLEAETAEFDLVFETNVKGAYFGSQAAAKRLVAQESGCIVNLSSTAGLYGVGDYVAYSASKGAIRLLTYSIADALGPHGVRANVIHPGVVETQMTREDSAVLDSAAGEAFRETVALGRFGEPGEVAGAAVFLASDLASYVTGESLVVDGGVRGTG